MPIGCQQTTTFPSGSPDARLLGLHWRRDFQRLHFGDTIFLGEGPTVTEPSHDLCHLFVAVNGDLPWYPAGPDREWRLAEYNAVFVEYLLHLIFRSTAFQAEDDHSILRATFRHAEWFVQEHYAPFPVQPHEAFEQLRSNLNPYVIERLSPLFFELHDREYNDITCKRDGVDLEFRLDAAPAAVGSCLDFKRNVRRLLEKVLGR